MKRTSRKKITRWKAFLYVFFSFLCVLLIPTVTAVSMTLSSLGAIEKEVGQANSTSFRNATNEIDDMFTTIINLSYKLSVDSRVRSYIYMGEKDTVTEMELSTALANSILGYDYIEYAYIYQPVGNQITSSVSYSLSDFVERKYSCGETDFTGLISSVNNAAFLNIPQKNDEAARNGYAFVRKIAPRNTLMDAAVVLQINQDSVKRKLLDTSFISGSQMIICNQNQILSSTANNAISEIICKSVQNASSNRNQSMQLDIDGAAYLCQYYQSPLTGFIYAHAVPVKNLGGSSYFTSQYVALILVFTVGASLAICWFFAKRNYVQLEKILSLFKKPKNNTAANVYRLIEDSVMEVTDENRTLSTTLTRQANQLRESYLEKLLTGKIKYFDNIDDFLKMHHIEFTESYFACLLFDISNKNILFEEEEISDGQRERLQHFILENILCELCLRIKVGYFVDCGDFYICVVNCPDNKSTELLTEVGREASDFILTHFNLTADYYCSSILNGLHNLPEAFSEVRDAWENRACEKEPEYAACVSQCLEIIKTHYSDSSLCVSQIADTLSLSSSYLSRYFKQQTGIGLLDYIHQYRLVLVKRLLIENPGRSINSIAEETGFYNTSALIRVFKKYEGMTPGQYRQQT